jgi:hypothetical protein
VLVQMLELDDERTSFVGLELDARGMSRCDARREVVAVDVDLVFDVCAND